MDTCISARTQVADQDLEADAGTQAQLGISKAPTAIDQLKESGRQMGGRPRD